jgi:hypothetical protein
MKDTTTHYSLLFERLVSDLGNLAQETSTGVIGFSAGGPVSMVAIPGTQAWVTCELSLYSEQIPSSENLRFELLSRLAAPKDEIQKLLGSLGDFSMEARLGHGHTVDVSVVSGIGGLALVSLRLYSSTTIGSEQFGIYEVIPADK